MRHALAVVVLAACGSDPEPMCDVGMPCGSPDATVSDAPFTGDPLSGIGSVEVVQGGFMFTEGPQWRDASGDLVFSDIPANTIYRYTPGGSPPEPLRTPSGNANGLALDRDGALIAAQHGTRSITRDGTDVVSEYMTESLNSPNDVIVTEHGIYFTDPPYGLQGGQNASDLGFMGVFFRANDGTLTAEHQGAPSTRPNGIGVSPDGRTLYVADTSDGRVYTFTVGDDGHLSDRTMFAMTAGGPDGLAIDAAGNVFVTTVDGVEVFAPSASRWGMIEVPMQPANCAFGDADHRTLYITARTTLYKVRLANAGLPTH